VTDQVWQIDGCRMFWPGPQAYYNVWWMCDTFAACLFVYCLAHTPLKHSDTLRPSSFAPFRPFTPCSLCAAKTESKLNGKINSQTGNNLEFRTLYTIADFSLIIIIFYLQMLVWFLATERKMNQNFHHSEYNLTHRNPISYNIFWCK